MLREFNQIVRSQKDFLVESLESDHLVFLEDESKVFNMHHINECTSARESLVQ